MIKFNFEKFWKGEKREVLFLKRYGFLANIVTIEKNQLLVQKLYAYLNRRETQPRDIYDIVWLTGKGAYIDSQFIKRNNLPSDLVRRALEKFKTEEKKLAGFRQKLAPFLINEEHRRKIEFFPQVLHSIMGA